MCFVRQHSDVADNSCMTAAAQSVANTECESPSLGSLTKDVIENAKANGSTSLQALIARHSDNVGDLLFILESLGTLPRSLEASWLYPLMEHENESVRVQAVKNVGKLCQVINLPLLAKIAREDESTLVRREAVSAIGRLRDESAIGVLTENLGSADPKIVCQAVRGLLVFKGRGEVDRALKALLAHPNETVRAMIAKAYCAKTAGDTEDKERLGHAETFAFLKNVAVNAEVRDVLRLVPAESVHLTFTSPPYYNARDYSIYASYEAYLDFLQEVFFAVQRVTKEGRFLIVNTSPVIVPRIGRSYSSRRYPIPFDLHARLVKTGWVFIDDIVWLKPEYSVKNRVGGFMQHRKPLAYKPNAVTEYLMVYRKQTDKLLDWNMRQYDAATVEASKVADGFETTNVWRICPKADKVHSAVFPEELCQRVVEYYSYKGDLVFDPFGGSGTLARTAQRLGRSFFTTEQDEKYFEYMKGTFISSKGESLFEQEGGGAKFLTLEQFKQYIEQCAAPSGEQCTKQSTDQHKGSE